MIFRMYKNRILHRLLGFLCMMMLAQASSLAQRNTSPDFRNCFESLKANHVYFLKYNDSLFLKQNYHEWSALYKRGSAMVAKKYHENQTMIQSLRDFFSREDYSVSPEVYQKFLDGFFGKFAPVDSVDPFRLLYMCRFLERIGKNVPESQRAYNLINAWRLHSYVQMWNLGGDVNYLKKAYECGKFVLSDEARKYAYYDYAYTLAMRYMTRTMWLVYHLQTVDEYRENNRRLTGFLARKDLDQWMDKEWKRELEHIQSTSDEALVRNTYLIGDTISMGKHEADSLMRVIIARNLAVPNLPALSKIRTLYMQMSIAQITPRMAWKQAIDYYHVIWDKVKDKPLTTRQLDEYLQPFYTFFYINYKADIPVDVKRKTVQEMCSNMEKAYLNCPGNRDNTDYVRDLLRLSTYDKVMMYLTPDEVKHFLSTLNVATQTMTYAHSVYTTKVAEELTKAILTYEPSLFVGVLNCQTPTEVLKNKNKILHFVKEACMYHDIGKNSIASVVKHGYKPLFREDVELYRRHPEFALDYLKVTPSLAQYSDVALGHHKWYDGKGGYPEKFDNTQSSLRFIIDVVALSVSIDEMAEESLEESPTKSVVGSLMERLRKGSGTQYNPDLVALIDGHSNLMKKLGSLIEDERMKVYYDVFSKNFVSK